MPKIIAIEGVDGVGKTTLCELLNDKLQKSNTTVAKTPFSDYNNLTSLAKLESDFGSFCSFLISDIAVKNQLSNYEWIILDRYILSTLIYHDKQIGLLKDSIHNILNYSGLLRPTVTIFLEANSVILEERHNERKARSRHSLTTFELQMRYERYLKDSLFQPYIGQLIKFRSETSFDQIQILEKIVDIIM